MKTRSKCKLVITTLLTLCMVMQVVFTPAASTGVKAAEIKPDPNFHIYIAFGQSNMDGNATPEAQDKEAPEGFLNMCTDDNHEGQTVGEWYPGAAPLSRQGGGLGVADYFGRKMLEIKQEENPNAKIGIICVAVPGCASRMFDKDDYQAYLDDKDTADWLVKIAKQYGSNPYQRIVESAKKAKEQGIIKGFIYHQGETDAADSAWVTRVAKVYNDLVADIGLDSNIPFIAGECVSKMSGQNSNINKLTTKGDNFYVASSEGLAANENDGNGGVHFTAEAYREYGPRYTEIMLEHEPKTTYSEPVYEWSADNTTVKASRHCNELPSYVEEEKVTVTRKVVKEATATAPGTVELSADFKNPAFTKQTKEDIITQSASGTPTAAPSQSPTAAPGATTTPDTNNSTKTVEKKLSLSSVKCKKNTKKITGKVSESGATVKIKVGKKAAKKATVKGKKFTLNLSYKLKKKTKVVITATKKDFKSCKKTYTVK